MKSTSSVPDYRLLRPKNVLSADFSHILLLLFWPVHGVVFGLLEQARQVDSYYPMYCRLDDLIPFNEWFVIPYIYWFVYLIGMLVYTFFRDVPVFRQMMRFVILTYSASLLIFFLFPNCQELRPESFQRDNIFTRFMANFYEFDTNTNVFPSLHVVGSMASLFASWKARGLNTPLWRTVSLISAVLIILSTVFLKQHSVLDIFGGLLVSALGYFLCFYNKKT